MLREKIGLIVTRGYERSDCEQMRKKDGTIISCNYSRFFSLVKFLRIMQQSNENKMTADNISTCWWPSMLHPRSQSFEDLAIEAQLANIFRLFIEKTDFFFGDKMEEEEEVQEDGDMQALLPDQMDEGFVGEI